jgi:hypothetical protein
VGQSTAESMTPHERILKYVKLADHSGKRFAFKYEQYELECQAEARFILTVLILERPELLNAAKDEEIFLKIVIARRLRNYFRNKNYSEIVGVHPKDGQTLGEFKEDHTQELSMIDEMESLFPAARDLIEMWRKGFDLEEMMFIDARAMKIVKDMLKVKRMITRSRKASQRKLDEAA